MSNANRVSHTKHDDWTKVRQGVGGHGCGHEHEGECPELKVLEMMEELAHGERIWDSVATIALNTLSNEVGFLLSQKRLCAELALSCSLVWEVLDDEPSANCDSYGQQALNDEDPLPAIDARKTVHLDQTIGQNRRPASHENGDQIEPSQALLNLKSNVPAGDEVNTAREETRFEKTEQETAGCKCLVALDETLTHHDYSP